ncbi:MAG: DUF5106 domain-containing protein [Alistipes sp.]|nr:DUF5106 domain-containing protein [Alistipes sp.]
MRRIALAIIVALICLSCTSKQEKQSVKQEQNAPAKSYRFRYVQPPTMATEEQQVLYMRDHFWDKFDFADSLWIIKGDSADMIRAYVAYVVNFVGPLNQEPIRKLMQKASVSKPMFEYFVSLSNDVLHDPNSPYRSDELYIAVLEAQIASPFYDKYEKMVPEYDLRIVSQNRIGRPANDFDYTVKSGKTKNLYSLKSDFVIVYINNPGCAMCRDITTALKQSPIISEMQRKGELKILAIYPDEDLNEWHKHYADLPAEWENGYDKGCLIRRGNLYNTSAIPALYLLDKSKTVLVKDSTNVGEIEAILSQHTTR